MPKNAVTDWDTTAALNTDIGGINIDEGCPARNINNAIRESMKQIASAHTAYAWTILDDANAGAARTTLELGTIATQAANNVSITGGAISGITDLAVADGGTGASNAGGALTNLGIAAQAEATWEAGEGTTEGVVSPAKVAAAIAALGTAAVPTQTQETWDTGTDTTESKISAEKLKAAILTHAPADSTTYGDVGTYVWARRGTGSTDVSAGSTLAGSNLVPTSGASGLNDTGAGSAINFSTGSALSGTWRAMGEYDHTVNNGGKTLNGATLWLRIS